MWIFEVRKGRKPTQKVTCQEPTRAVQGRFRECSSWSRCSRLLRPEAAGRRGPRSGERSSGVIVRCLSAIFSAASFAPLRAIHEDQCNRPCL
jgi:hypothetical protein